MLLLLSMLLSLLLLPMLLSPLLLPLLLLLLLNNKFSLTRYKKRVSFLQRFLHDPHFVRIRRHGDLCGYGSSATIKQMPHLA